MISKDVDFYFMQPILREMSKYPRFCVKLEANWKYLPYNQNGNFLLSKFTKCLKSRFLVNLNVPIEWNETNFLETQDRMEWNNFHRIEWNNFQNKNMSIELHGSVLIMMWIVSNRNLVLFVCQDYDKLKCFLLSNLNGLIGIDLENACKTRFDWY